MGREVFVVIAALSLLVAGCSCQRDAAESGAETGAAEARVEYADGRVSLGVRDALALSVLEQLAGQAGFALEVNRADPRRVTLELDGVSLAEAIAALMGQERYALEYAFDPAVSRHVITALSLGDALSPAVAAAGAAAPAPAADADPRERRQQDRLSRRQERLQDLRGDLKRGGDRLYEERVREQLAEERQAIQQELRQALGDPDPAKRAAAVEGLDTDDPGARDAVADLGQNDPDPAVRLAAAEALGFDDTYDSKTALRDMAATEQDPAVKAEILGALGDDPSFYETLKACCAGHPDFEYVDPPGE